MFLSITCHRRFCMAKYWALLIKNRTADKLKIEFTSDCEKFLKDDLDDDDKLIAKLLLSEKSALAYECQEGLFELDRAEGEKKLLLQKQLLSFIEEHEKSRTCFYELMCWLNQRTAEIAFLAGQLSGHYEPSAFTANFNRLSGGEF